MVAIFEIMRNYLLIFFLGLGISVYAQGTEQILTREMKARQNSTKSLLSNAINKTNIIYDRLELSVDPAIRYLHGKVTTTFVTDTVLDFMEFDLTDTLTADSVVYHGQHLLFTHGNDILHINLSPKINAGVIDSIAIFYQGAPDSSGMGSFVCDTHDSVPIMWTLSEPYGARDWWPCKQDLTDKIDSIDVLITCPAQYKAAGNGLLVEQIPVGANITYHWKHRYPIATYLVCMAVTNYQVFTNLVPFRGDTLKILNYVYPEDYDADTAGSKR